MYRRGSFSELTESVIGGPPFSKFISLANSCRALFVTMAFIKIALFRCYYKWFPSLFNEQKLADIRKIIKGI
jgi:predicted MFS family arabinose efflux permease